jgi:hypothetical protein
MADNLPPSSADVTESRSLNLPESSGPHRPVMGLPTHCIGDWVGPRTDLDSCGKYGPTVGLDSRKARLSYSGSYSVY